MKSEDNHYPGVVVLGLGRNGLSIIRSLAPNGIEVTGVTLNQTDLGIHSRWLKKIVTIEDTSESEKIVEIILELGKSNKSKPVLMMDSDYFVSLVSNFRERFEQYFLFNIFPTNFSKTFETKLEMMKMAKRNGLNVARTVLYNNKNSDSIYDLSFPLIVKPINSYSVLWNYSDKALLMESKESLSKLLEKRSDLAGKVIIQELIEGPATNSFWCHAYVNKDGEASAISVVRKIFQYRPMFETGSYVMSKNFPQLELYAKMFLKKINYRGAVSIEFKYDEKKKLFMFIELNPRRPLHHMLMTECGCNLSLMEYRDLVNVKVEVYNSQNFVDGKTYIFADSELKRSFFFNGGISRLFFDTIIRIIKSDYYSTFDKADIKPFLYSIYLYIEKFSRL